MAPDLLVPRKDKVDGDDALQARRKGKVKQHRESKHACVNEWLPWLGCLSNLTSS